MGAKPSLVRRVRLPAEDRVFLAVTQQDTQHVTRQDKSLMHKEKGQYTRHVTPQDTLQAARQDTAQDSKRPS